MMISFASFAAFKRSVVVGMRFKVDNLVRPAANGAREISRVQTNAIAYWFTDSKGERVEGWAHYPKSSKQIRVEGERVSWLAEDGTVLWTYFDFEK